MHRAPSQCWMVAVLPLTFYINKLNQHSVGKIWEGHDLSKSFETSATETFLIRLIAVASLIPDWLFAHLWLWAIVFVNVHDSCLSVRPQLIQIANPPIVLGWSWWNLFTVSTKWRGIRGAQEVEVKGHLGVKFYPFCKKIAKASTVWIGWSWNFSQYHLWPMVHVGCSGIRGQRSSRGHFGWKRSFWCEMNKTLLPQIELDDCDCWSVLSLI